ncbi:embryonic polyadenylate-binding protein 2-B-like isoform X1 [Rana temporaria]|uniref:embryonic polyadenylate-binding protein 2-B-like isoform X1 n=1 Tax=Rana temporaria TaxID=8407 RepID=UPI001AAC47D4|nr:embryonic polyadenylate-binding protein 2-B-like isoform X1 [Rana temporaria]
MKSCEIREEMNEDFSPPACGQRILGPFPGVSVLIQADSGGGGVWADHGRFSPQWDVGLAMSDKIPKQEPGLSEGDHGDEGDLDDPELTAIRMRVREMEEETERLKDLMTDETNSPMTESREDSLPYTHRRAGGASLRQVPRARHAGPNWPVPFRLPFMERNSPFYGQPKGLPQPVSAEEKREADKRSVYVGNVDYGGTAQDLESHFGKCGSINRITILCDKFSGHPKGYAYIEFTEEHSAEAATELDESVFRGRTIKVLPKRTNVPGISTTDRGNFRGRFRGPRGSLPRGPRSRGPMSRGQYSRGQMPRGQAYRGRGRSGWWNNPR